MPLPLTAISDLAEATIAALVAGWPVDAEPLPERRYVSDGLVVWDCDSLIVMVEATFGTAGDVAAESFQSQGLGFAMRAAILGVALLRCVPDVDDNGNPPAVADVEASSKMILKDAVAMFNVLAEAQDAGGLATCQGLAFERWTSEGPAGGVGGGVLRFRALLL